MPLAALSNVVSETFPSLWPYLGPLVGGVLGFVASEWKGRRSQERARELERAHHLQDRAVAAHERMLEAIYLASVARGERGQQAPALAGVRLHSTDEAFRLADDAFNCYYVAWMTDEGKVDRTRILADAEKVTAEYVKVAREQLGRLPGD